DPGLVVLAVVLAEQRGKGLDRVRTSRRAEEDQLDQGRGDARVLRADQPALGLVPRLELGRGKLLEPLVRLLGRQLLGLRSERRSEHEKRPGQPAQRCCTSKHSGDKNTSAGAPVPARAPGPSEARLRLSPLALLAAARIARLSACRERPRVPKVS